VLCRRGGPDDAALLPVRRHGEHRLEDGVHRGAMAHPPEPGDEGPIDAGRRLPHRVPRPDRRQGQGQDADVLAARQAGLRQGAPHTAAPRVSCSVPRPNFLSLGRISRKLESSSVRPSLSRIYRAAGFPGFIFDRVRQAFFVFITPRYFGRNAGGGDDHGGGSG